MKVLNSIHVPNSDLFRSHLLSAYISLVIHLKIEVKDYRAAAIQLGFDPAIPKCPLRKESFRLQQAKMHDPFDGAPSKCGIKLCCKLFSKIVVFISDTKRRVITFMSPTIFETERLVAKRWNIKFAEQALQIYSDPKVTEFIPKTHCDSIEEKREAIEWNIQRNKKWDEPLGSFPVFLRSTGEMVGCSLIKNLPDGDGNLTNEIEIGWHLGSSYWGKGLATEFGKKLIHIGLTTLRIPELWAVTDLENTPSQAVCKRLGMKHVGRTEKYYGMELELFHLSSDK